MILGVQHIVNDIFFLQEPADDFRLIDGSRADKDRLARSVSFLHFTDYGTVLGVLCFINDIGKVFADRRPVRRNDIDIELVNFIEFIFFRLCRTGHTGQFLIHTEIILEGNRCQGLAFTLDLDVFLRLNRLMQSVAVTAAEHEPARKFIDNNYFSVFDNIIFITMHHKICA